MANYDDTATVSGSVVSIENGADDVWAKSCVVTVSPTLSGISSVSETQTGRNLLPNEKYQGASTRVNIGQTDDGYSLHLKAGTYTLSATSLVQMRAYYRTSTGGSNVLIWSTYGTSGSGTFTLSEDSDVRIWLYNGDDGLSVSDVQTFQLEFGSTAHEYEPYAPTVYTASLGRTIYGGQVDIVNGVGTKDGVIEVFDTVEGNVIKSQFNSFNKVNGNISVLGTNVRITFAVESGDQSAYNRISNTYEADEQICNLASHSFSYASDTTHWYRNTVLYLFLPVTDVGTTAESVYNYLTGLITNGTPLKFYLPYNTPTDFTFDGQEIPTRLGYNAFWSEQGNTELTYYKDGYGFTSVTVHKETPDGEPVEVTRKLHRIIYEGQVDVISGTGLIYRGESGTEYDPPETFTFPPISMETDDGENTLYAGEGDSAITYRKDTE